MDRTYRRLAILVALVLLVGLATACGLSSRPVAEGQIPGEYNLRTVSGMEELVLLPDGNYLENYTVNAAAFETSGFKPGIVHHNEGKWKYSRGDGKPRVTLEDAIVDMSIEPPVLSDWEFEPILRSDGQIVLNAHDPDGVIVLKKVP